MKQIVLYFLILISLCVLLILYYHLSSYVISEGFGSSVISLSQGNIDNLTTNLTNIFVVDIVTYIKDRPASLHPKITATSTDTNSLFANIGKQITSPSLAPYIPLDHYLTSDYVSAIRIPIHAAIDNAYPIYGKTADDLKKSREGKDKYYWRKSNTSLNFSKNIYDMTALQFDYLNRMNIKIHEMVEYLFTGSSDLDVPSTIKTQLKNKPVFIEGLYVTQDDLKGILMNAANAAIETMDDLTTFIPTIIADERLSPFSNDSLTIKISAMVNMNIPQSSSDIDSYVQDCQNRVKNLLVGNNTKDTISRSIFPDLDSQGLSLSTTQKYRMNYFLDYRNSTTGIQTIQSLQSNGVTIDNFLNNVFSQNILMPQPDEYPEGYVLTKSSSPSSVNSLCQDGYTATIANLGDLPGQNYVCINKEHEDTLIIPSALTAVNALV